ncbi:hypothetical protein B0H34DRAFT_803159 [Crassisporium funariophilum]|nr:hypothetical protein B0H34DRAFT_803159 [Crassisporium funariophilum]
MLPLWHGVTLEDLNCSEELWMQSPNNPQLRPEDRRAPTSLMKLLKLYPETLDAAGLFQRERFNAWKFLYNLIYFGPDYFRKYKSKFGLPEEVKTIPVKRTTQIPNTTLNTSPNAPAQNAEALKAFFCQTGIGDPTENPKSAPVNNQVILIFGDLLTGEQI